MAAEYNRGCSQLALNSPERRGDQQPRELPSADAVARVVGRRVLRGVPWQYSTDEERKLFCSMLRVLPQHRSDCRQLKELILHVCAEEDCLSRKTSTGTQKLRKASLSTGKLGAMDTMKIPSTPQPQQQQQQQQQGRQRNPNHCCIQ